MSIIQFLGFVVIWLLMPLLFIPEFRSMFTRKSRVATFKLLAYSKSGDVIYETKGLAGEWRNYHTISLPFPYVGALFSLEPDWFFVLNNRLCDYQTEVIGYNTVRKFNEAIQYKYPVQVRFIITYK